VFLAKRSLRLHLLHQATLKTNLQCLERFRENCVFFLVDLFKKKDTPSYTFARRHLFGKKKKEIGCIKLFGSPNNELGKRTKRKMYLW
jgi:hypothetical protein